MQAPTPTKRILAETPDGKSFWVTVPIFASAQEKQKLAMEQYARMNVAQAQSAPAPEDVNSSFVQQPTIGGQPSTPDNGTISAAPNDFVSKAVGFLRNILPASSTGVVNALPQDASAQELLSKSSPGLEALGGLGATLGVTALGGPAGLAAAAGAFSMPAIHEIIRNYLGQGPSDTLVLPQMGGLGPVLEQGTVNEVGGRVLGTLGKGIQAAGMTPAELAANTGVSESAIRLGGTTGQLLGKDTLPGKAASFAEDIFARGAKNKSITETGQNVVNAIKAGLSNASPIQNLTDDTLNELLNNDVKLGRFFQNGSVNIKGRVLSANNAKRDLQAAFIEKIFKDNSALTDLSDLTKVSLNSDSMINQFGQLLRDQEKFANPLFSKQQIDNMNEFFQAVRQTTDIGHGLGAYFNLNMGRQALGLTGLVLAGKVAGVASPASVLGGFVGTSAIARLLTNRKAAPIFLNMIKGQPLGMSAQAASRIIMNTLTRQPISLQMKDGTEKQGIIGPDGQIKSFDEYLTQ